MLFTLKVFYYTLFLNMVCKLTHSHSHLESVQALNGCHVVWLLFLVFIVYVYSLQTRLLFVMRDGNNILR